MIQSLITVPCDGDVTGGTGFTTVFCKSGGVVGRRVTPLIDVMLVLLIIFIITLPSQTHSIKIDNPLPVPEQPRTPPVVIALQIDFDGTLLRNNVPVDRATFRGYISTEALKSPQPEVYITVDKFASYEVVVQTLADLQRLGLNKIGFVNDDF